MPDRPSGRRLLIVEEALKDYVGHWYEYVRAVAELAQGEGDRVSVVGHRRATPALVAELAVEPLFARSPWDGDYREPFAPWRKLAILRHAWQTVRQIGAVLRRRGPFDCTFVPTVFVFQIWAWWLLYALYPARIGRLVLLVRNNVATYRPDSAVPVFGGVSHVIGWGIRAFAGDVAAGRVVFATDSRRLAAEYRELTGIDFVVFPSPRIAAPMPARPRRRAAQPMHFACLGPARFEKGIDVLQQAIARYLADPASPPARFTIQWPAPIRDAAGQRYEPDSGLAASGQVAFVTEPLDSAGYDALLGQTDCMVLPYRRSAYFARISGVAVEAVTAGIPVITTADTWTAELVETAGAGLLVPDGDAASLTAALATLAARRPRFARLAAERSKTALAAHSGEEFMRALWGESGAGQGPASPVRPARLR